MREMFFFVSGPNLVWGCKLNDGKIIVIIIMIMNIFHKDIFFRKATFAKSTCSEGIIGTETYK